MVFGFAATGSAGKASIAAPFILLAVVGGLESGCEDKGGGGLDDDEEEEEAEGATHGVAPTRPAPTLLAEGAGVEEGNGFVAVELPQLPCLLTAERDDCAVELLSLRTRRPPLPAAAAEEPGKTPLGPGKDG